MDSHSLPALCLDCGAAANQPPACPACGRRRIIRHEELFTLNIAHVDCDAFYASLEKRVDPSLADRQVIVGGGVRGVVTTACYVARTYGVRSAMPMFRALKACPDAVVIKPNFSKYAAAAKEVRALMLTLTPLVEPLSIDEAFKSKGALTLNWIGCSSEAIPQADQPTAVKNGVVDFHFAAFSAYERVVPVTIGAPLNQHTPMEDRKNGIYEFWSKAFEGFGVHYFGTPHSPGNYYFFLKKPIKNPKADFKGMKLRTSNTYVAFIKALGAVPVTIPTNETYSALQTGLVDGSGWVCDSFDTLKGYEVLKDWVGHPKRLERQLKGR